jgi:hypothetical protein
MARRRDLMYPLTEIHEHIEKFSELSSARCIEASNLGANLIKALGCMRDEKHQDISPFLYLIPLIDNMQTQHFEMQRIVKLISQVIATEKERASEIKRENQRYYRDAYNERRRKKAREQQQQQQQVVLDAVDLDELNRILGEQKQEAPSDLLSIAVAPLGIDSFSSVIPQFTSYA